MAEQQPMTDAQFKAMDHDLAAQRSGQWLPAIPEPKLMTAAEFNAMDHAMQYAHNGLENVHVEQANPGEINIGEDPIGPIGPGH